VTATPYSLYLQPENYAPTGSDFVFEPKRPAFTVLLPIHPAYVGGDRYFGEYDSDEPEYYLWHEVSKDELDALRNLAVVLRIIDLIEPTLVFDSESGYEFDWNGLRAAIEYFATIAAPKSERNNVWILAETDRELSRFRPGGRVSNAPDTKQQAKSIASVATNLPALLLIGQKGRKEQDWGGYPFWWPVFFAPSKSVPVVFASETKGEQDQAQEVDD
jgi:hypothetical protein